MQQLFQTFEMSCREKIRDRHKHFGPEEFEEGILRSLIKSDIAMSLGLQHYALLINEYCMPNTRITTFTVELQWL